MKRLTKIGLTLGTLLVSAALVAPAEASDRHRHRHRDGCHRVTRDHHRHGHHERQRQRQRDRSAYHNRFEIPVRIHGDFGHSYDPYFERNVYFAPHRHQHSVYRFPVRVDQGWEYRNQAYCGGELFRTHTRVEYHGRRFSVRFGF